MWVGFLAVMTGLGAAEPSDEAALARAYVDRGIAQVEQLENGTEVADYLLCSIQARQTYTPYYATMSPAEVYPQYATLGDELERLFAEYDGHVGHLAFEAAFNNAIEERGLSGCALKLIPSPVYLRRMADEAEVRLAHVQGRRDVAAEYRAHVEQTFEELRAHSDGDTLVSVTGCYALTSPQQHPRNGVDLLALAADREQLQRDIDAQIEREGPLNAVRADGVDIDAIWREVAQAALPGYTAEGCLAYLHQMSAAYPVSATRTQ